MSRSSVATGPLEWRLVLGGACLFAAGLLARGLLGRPKTRQIVASPRSTLLPTLSQTEIENLPYPSDSLPGARDVDSPYGSVRVYEFGPPDGRKVVLVHGISTPCVALGAVAHGLADHGCRVLLFDLFGRGYSDNPVDLPQDIRLFTSQILLALASSPIPWTGTGAGKFSMLGYSLGGGICAAFASYFPDLVDSLILVAPSGLLRPQHISKTNHILYSEGILPEAILERIISKRLRTPLAAPLPKPSVQKREQIDVSEAVLAEVNTQAKPQATLSRARPHVSVERTVAYQLDHHRGFVPAFISSIRHAPIARQHDRWRMIGDRLLHDNEQDGTQKKVLIVCGATDPIIVRSELQEDAAVVLSGLVEFAVFPAGHEIPVTKGDEVVETILDFWRRTSGENDVA